MSRSDGSTSNGSTSSRVPVWRRERADAFGGCRELVEAVEGEEHVDAVGRR